VEQVLIHIDNLEHGRALEHLGHPFIPGHDHCITRSGNDGRLLGGVLFQNYRKRSIEMHVQGFEPGWRSKWLLWMAFDYPFNQLGVEKIIGFVPSTRPEVLAFDLKIGFVVETAITDVVEDGGLVVVSMTRSQCRWLKLPRGTPPLG
jgi:hypothetical protein